MSEPNISPQPKLSHTTSIVLCAMFTALTYAFTIIGVPIPFATGGLLHLGNVPFFVAAILFGKKIGMISGGVGMALFDVLSPYAIWAPYTLVIGLATGYVVGLITERNQSFRIYICAMGCASVVKVVGYYLAEGKIYGNWISAFNSVPVNLLQVIIAGIIVWPLTKKLRIAANNTILRGH
jgi:uncharacterized membrane protein